MSVAHSVLTAQAPTLESTLNYASFIQNCILKIIVLLVSVLANCDRIYVWTNLGQHEISAVYRQNTTREEVLYSWRYIREMQEHSQGGKKLLAMNPLKLLMKKLWKHLRLPYCSKQAQEFKELLLKVEIYKTEVFF